MLFEAENAGVFEPLFDYPNKSYTRVEGLTGADLKELLMEVYEGYPEYSDPDYGGGTFLEMVQKFAHDDFYKYHFVAKRYLTLYPAEPLSSRFSSFLLENWEARFGHMEMIRDQGMSGAELSPEYLKLMVEHGSVVFGI